jgi:hypothetical protein
LYLQLLPAWQWPNMMGKDDASKAGYSDAWNSTPMRQLQLLLLLLLWLRCWCGKCSCVVLDVERWLL